MRNETALQSCSAVELTARLRRGDLSALEVLDAHLAHIEAHNPRVNAIVVPLYEQARAAARSADAARARGDVLGPLHAVPMTVKEQFNVAGTATTIGLRSQRGRIREQDGPLVARLRAAGALVVGKSNVMQTLAGWETDNPVYGRTLHPQDASRSPGGSSGGDACAVAMGFVPLALAGDVGGSIRLPAHCCGVHGFKPTPGRFTLADSPAELFAFGQEAITAQPGPLARHVEDLMLALRVMSGDAPAPGPDIVPPVPWRDPSGRTVEALRVGVFEDDAFFPVSPALRRAVREAAMALRARGVIVEPFAPPELREAVSIFLGIFTADGGAQLRGVLGTDQPIPALRNQVRRPPPAALKPLIATLMRAGGQEYGAWQLMQVGTRSAADYWRMVEARTRYRARFLEQMNAQRLDALLCPPFGLPAPLHESTEHLLPAAAYALLFNVLGFPAGVVATTRIRPGEESERGESRDRVRRTAAAVERGSAGLPVGVQIAGRPWSDETVLALMAAAEAGLRGQPDYPLGRSNSTSHLVSDPKPHT